MSVSSQPADPAVPSQGGDRPQKGGDNKTKTGAILDLLALLAIFDCCCSSGSAGGGWPEAGRPPEATRGRQPAQQDVRSVQDVKPVPLTDTELASDLLPPNSERADALFPDLGGALDLRNAEVAFPDVSTPDAPPVAVDAISVTDSRAGEVFPDVQPLCASLDVCRADCGVRWQGHPCRKCPAGVLATACVRRYTSEGNDAVQTFLLVSDCSQCAAEAGVSP